MTLNVVAKRTKRAVSTVRNDLAAGKLKATKDTKNGRWDVSEEQLNDYIELIENRREATAAERRKRFEFLSKRLFKVRGHIGGAIRDFKHGVINDGNSPTLDITYTQLDNREYSDIFTIKSFARDNILITTITDAETGKVIYSKETTNGFK
jgi:hypothetical protein